MTAAKKSKSPATRAKPKAGSGTSATQKDRAARGKVQGEGDYASALKSSWKVFENVFRVPQVQHVPMEPHVSVARVDLSGKVEVHTSAQSPFTVRHLLSACFGLPHGDVRVHVPYVGGGFGGKAGINLEPIAVALAMRCRGRWVRLMVDRHEEFFATVVRQGLTATLVTVMLLARSYMRALHSQVGFITGQAQAVAHRLRCCCWWGSSGRAPRHPGPCRRRRTSRR